MDASDGAAALSPGAAISQAYESMSASVSILAAKAVDVAVAGTLAKRVSIGNIRKVWLARVPNQVADGQAAYFRIEPGAGQRFPSSDELQLLPVPLQQSIRETALAVLHYRLSPILAMHMRKRVKRKLLAAARESSELCSPPTTAFLSGLACFSRWENMQAVAQAFRPRVVAADEVIIHVKERETACLTVLGFGFATADPEPSKLFAAPSVLGLITVHSQHRQPCTVRCAGPEGVVWTLSYPDYHSMLRSQPHDVQRIHQEAAALYRERHMRKEHAELLTDAALRKFREFSVFPAELPDVLQSKLQPKVFRQGTSIYRSHEAANTLIYLLSGTVALSKQNLARTFAPVAARRRGSTGGPELGATFGAFLFDTSSAPSPTSGTRAVAPALAPGPALLAGVALPQLPPGTETRKAPAVLGDVSWIQSTKRRMHCMALTTCDVLVLHKDSMKLLISTLDATEIAMRSTEREPSSSADANAPSQAVGGATPKGKAGPGDDAASKKQTQPAASSQQKGSGGLGRDTRFLKFIPYIRGIPLLSHILPVAEDERIIPPVVLEMAEACRSVVYPPRATITSTTQVVDRLIFVVSGKAVVADAADEGVRNMERIRQMVRQNDMAQCMNRTLDTNPSTDANTPSFLGHVTLLPPAQSQPEHPPPPPALTSTGTTPQAGGGLWPPPGGLRSPADDGDERVGKSQKRSHTQQAMSPPKKARGEQRTVVLGECLGFPILEPHKWSHRVVAFDTVETIELPYDPYSNALQRHGLRAKVHALSRALLNPIMEKDELVREARRLLYHLRNTSMFMPRGFDEPALCRVPTVEVLSRLPPIPLQNRLQTCVYGAASLSRFNHTDRSAIDTTKLKPIVLGSHNKRVLPYHPPPLSADSARGKKKRY